MDTLLLFQSTAGKSWQQFGKCSLLRVWSGSSQISNKPRVFHVGLVIFRVINPINRGLYTHYKDSLSGVGCTLSIQVETIFSNFKQFLQNWTPCYIPQTSHPFCVPPQNAPVLPGPFPRPPSHHPSIWRLTQVTPKAQVSLFCVSLPSNLDGFKVKGACLSKKKNSRNKRGDAETSNSMGF